MTSGTSPVEDVVTDPATFEAVATGYDDEVACYRDLRDEAKRTLGSFDEYLDFYAAVIESGPTDYVYYDLETNAVRSLKNMVLRSSRSGKRFPVDSARELQRRIDSYQSLGVDAVTPRTTTYTIIEHLLDDDHDRATVYRTLSQLLGDLPTDGAELTKLLVHARFVFATETLASTNPAVERYLAELHEDLPDPLPNDGRGAQELMAEADSKPFADPDKQILTQASLARQSSMDVLQDYLYLTARDIVERYRHQQQNDPWRGELQLAVRQFNGLLNLYENELESNRLNRVESYRQLALAELNSGGRWQSLRDPRDLPDPQFLSAGNHYFRAAHQIKPLDLNRYIKYLSKAFQNQAIAARHRELGPAHGWSTTQQIHDRTISLLTTYIDQLDTEEYNGEEEAISKTIVGAIGTHKFRKHRAAAVVAFERRNDREVGRHLDEAWEHIDATPTYEDTDLLETLRTLSAALSLEMEEMYEQAQRRYQEVEDDMFDLNQRIALVNIKHNLTQGSDEVAVSTAETAFNENSPIRTAVQLISDESPSSPSIYPPILEDVSAVDPETKWWFTMLVYLASKHDSSGLVQNHVLDTLLEL